MFSRLYLNHVWFCSFFIYLSSQICVIMNVYHLEYVCWNYINVFVFQWISIIITGNLKLTMYRCAFFSMMFMARSIFLLCSCPLVYGLQGLKCPQSIFKICHTYSNDIWRLWSLGPSEPWFLLFWCLSEIHLETYSKPIIFNAFCCLRPLEPSEPIFLLFWRLPQTPFKTYSKPITFNGVWHLWSLGPSEPWFLLFWCLLESILKTYAKPIRLHEFWCL